MIKSTFRISLLGLMALALAALPVSAAEKAEKADQPEAAKEAKPPRVSKAERTGVAVPFRGTLTAKTDASITIKERVLEVTSETKIMKSGKPATLADGEIGKPVSGQYRKLDGRLIARTIFFGDRPGAADKVKVKVEQPVAKPEVKPETPAK